MDGTGIISGGKASILPEWGDTLGNIEGLFEVESVASCSWELWMGVGCGTVVMAA